MVNVCISSYKVANCDYNDGKSIQNKFIDGPMHGYFLISLRVASSISHKNYSTVKRTVQM